MNCGSGGACTEYLEPVDLEACKRPNGAAKHGPSEPVSEKHLNKILSSLNETKQGIKSLWQPASTHSYLSKFSSTLRLIRHKSSSNPNEPPASEKLARRRSPSPVPARSLVSMSLTGGVNHRRYTQTNLVGFMSAACNRPSNIGPPTLISKTIGGMNFIELKSTDVLTDHSDDDESDDEEDSSFDELRVSRVTQTVDHHSNSLTIMPNTIITNVYEENGTNDSYNLNFTR